jgi:hypothetical protein
MFQLAGQAPLDVDLIHDGTDPLLLQIRAQIELLRVKMRNIGGDTPVAKFDALMDRELQTYLQLRIPCEELRHHHWKRRALTFLSHNKVRPLYDEFDFWFG